jgi:hypothetical protein
VVAGITTDSFLLNDATTAEGFTRISWKIEKVAAGSQGSR